MLTQRLAAASTRSWDEAMSFFFFCWLAAADDDSDDNGGDYELDETTEISLILCCLFVDVGSRRRRLFLRGSEESG